MKAYVRGNVKVACSHARDQEMGVIVHEAVGVADPIIPFIDMLQGVQKVDVVLVVLVDGFLLVSP